MPSPSISETCDDDTHIAACFIVNVMYTGHQDMTSFIDVAIASNLDIYQTKAPMSQYVPWDVIVN